MAYDEHSKRMTKRKSYFLNCELNGNEIEDALYLSIMKRIFEFDLKIGVINEFNENCSALVTYTQIQ